MKSARTSSRAFTLIELMLVVAILGIALAMGYPSIAKALHRAPLSEAVWNVMEGCRKARALAILQGNPMELRIFPDHIEVVPSPPDADANAAMTPIAPSQPVLVTEEPKPTTDFTKPLSDSVAIAELKVNLMDVTASDTAARVRFYPNGTCDELTMVLFSPLTNEKRRITLESVTSLAGVEMIQ
jgi:prepilin-type N-terminal cleavage/methylation domain-containing protein